MPRGVIKVLKTEVLVWLTVNVFIFFQTSPGASETKCTKLCKLRIQCYHHPLF